MATSPQPDEQRGWVIPPELRRQLLAALSAKQDQPIAMPYEEFLETRFFREWARPQGLIDAVSSVLERSTTSAALVLVFRHERDGLVNDETRRRMRLIVPHVRRALLVSRLIAARTFEAETLAVAFDGLRAGVIVVETVVPTLIAQRFFDPRGRRFEATEEDIEEMLIPAE